MGQVRNPDAGTPDRLFVQGDMRAARADRRPFHNAISLSSESAYNASLRDRSRAIRARMHAINQRIGQIDLQLRALDDFT